MFLLSLCMLTILVGTSTASSLIIPCKTNDERCVINSANAAWQQIAAGVPSMGMETLDPSYYELIEGNLSIIKYKFMNTKITGLKNCKISAVKVNLEGSTLHLQFDCTNIILEGDYEVSGRLIILPVEGKGKYTLTTGDYTIEIDSEIRKVQGQDGKTYLNIKNFKLRPEARSQIKFDFKNLFNGQKDLSDTVHKFSHENWKEVSNLVQDPVWYAAMKKVINNSNKYLKHVPLEDMVLT